MAHPVLAAGYGGEPVDHVAHAARAGSEGRSHPLIVVEGADIDPVTPNSSLCTLEPLLCAGPGARGFMVLAGCRAPHADNSSGNRTCGRHWWT